MSEKGHKSQSIRKKSGYYSDQEMLAGGRVPPQSVDIEEAVIGATLMDTAVIEEIAAILTPEAFYTDAHQMIWRAILALFSNNEKIDIMTVTHALRRMGNLDLAGGAYYITQLTNRVASSAHAEYHARIVAQNYLKRQMIEISGQNIKDAYDDTSDTFELYHRSISRLEAAVSNVVKYDATPISRVHQRVMAENREIAASGHKSGVITGFTNLDNFTNGWQKTDLIILAGRPAMGKSVCALAFAVNPAIIEKDPTAVFSLEMSADQLIGRAQSGLSEIDSSRIIKKQLKPDEVDRIERRCRILNESPIYIDDTPALTILEFKAKSRRLVREKGVKLIVVDYLQLMRVDKDRYGGSRENEVSEISRSLKAIAKDLNVPIIALSQLSRAVEGRADKKPRLSDLRESGSIEQDADMVMFCYRPEYYGIQEYSLGDQIMPADGLMVIIVAKHRAGSLGELRFGFNGQFTKLENYDEFMEKKNGTWNRFPSDENYGRVEPNPAVLMQLNSTDESGESDDTPF